MSGLRNGFWCLIAFGLVAFASAPMEVDRAEQAHSQADAHIAKGMHHHAVQGGQ